MEQNQVNRLQMVQFECHKVGNPLVSFNLGLIVKAPFSLEESQARGTRTCGDSKRVRPSGESHHIHAKMEISLRNLVFPNHHDIIFHRRNIDMFSRTGRIKGFVNKQN